MNKVLTGVIAVVVAAMLIASVMAMYTAEAKSKTGKIKVGYGDVGGYHGKAKIKIWNEETGKVLVKEKLHFGKQYASQGDDCCQKTYEFKWRGNHVGDEINAVVVGAECGSWESGSHTLKKGTTRISVTVDEIGECN